MGNDIKKSVLSSPEIRAFRERFIQAIRQNPFPLYMIFGASAVIGWFRLHMSDADYEIFNSLDTAVADEPECVQWLMTIFIEAGMVKYDKQGNIIDVVDSADMETRN